MLCRGMTWTWGGAKLLHHEPVFSQSYGAIWFSLKNYELYSYAQNSSMLNSLGLTHGFSGPTWPGRSGANLTESNLYRLTLHYHNVSLFFWPSYLLSNETPMVLRSYLAYSNVYAALEEHWLGVLHTKVSTTHCKILTGPVDGYKFRHRPTNTGSSIRGRTAAKNSSKAPKIQLQEIQKLHLAQCFGIFWDFSTKCE